jgi:Tfp pilus assembly protein PilF
MMTCIFAKLTNKKLKKILGATLIVLAGLAPLTAFDNTNILVEQAVNHIYQKRYLQAHQTLKEAYEQSPRHPGVHFNLGRLFELTGNYNEALKEFRLAASLNSFKASL